MPSNVSTQVHGGKIVERNDLDIRAYLTFYLDGEQIRR